MSSNLPTVSVIVNVYNEEKIIPQCLTRIRSQTYPRDKIEIIIVDDDSTDRSIPLARKFGVSVVRSGYKNIERSKSIGIEHAKGELLLLLDADVFLVSRSYIRRVVELLARYPEAVAVQSIRWHYRQSDSAVERYCNLFGINDPLVFFLGKNAIVPLYAGKSYPYNESIKERGRDYLVAEFTRDTLPTVGAQGYTIRKRYALETSWKPYFFHMDTAYELVLKGHGQFILSFLEVEHRYVTTAGEFYRKLYRNMTLFLELRVRRKYTYSMSPLKLLFAVGLMMTLVYPFYQSVKGYRAKADIAWFLHPVFCFTVPLLYAAVMLRWKLRTAFVRAKYLWPGRGGP
ncbi:glycosyltransferase family 2 protein [Patescibacteria group bacterium]|nr:glycosyltransferase family 2 protein [Patescibacteria group bacterium]